MIKQYVSFMWSIKLRCSCKFSQSVMYLIHLLIKNICNIKQWNYSLLLISSISNSLLFLDTKKVKPYTFLCLVVGGWAGGSNCKFLRKNALVHLIIIRKWLKNQKTNLHFNPDNFPQVHFIWPPSTIRHKRV